MSIEAFTRSWTTSSPRATWTRPTGSSGRRSSNISSLRDGSPGRTMTRDQFKRFVQTLRAGIPDLHYTVEDAAQVGDRVWLRVRARGTDSGTGQFGHPPTGKPISIDVIDVARFADGQMIEHWGVPDRMSILQQLGHHA
jgi:predicted ester cyclase